ncbi:MAG: hypothetical protein NTX64_16460 [Elusimicrobia bacterium]|nr:hypothetical protein [Elusimicrobiota bacterium]
MAELPAVSLGRSKLPLLLVVACIAAGTALPFMFGLKGKSAPATKASPSFVPPQRPSNAVAAAALGRGLDLPSPRGPGAGSFEMPLAGSSGVQTEMSLDDFLGLLDKGVPKPVADKVVHEFTKQPQLEQAWKVYKKMRGPTAPAREFVNYINRIPAFRQLVSKFEKDSAFKQAVSEVLKNPEVNRVVKTGMPNYTGARRVDQAAIAREWAGKAHVNAIQGGGAPAGGGGAKAGLTVAGVPHTGAAAAAGVTGAGPVAAAAPVAGGQPMAGDRAAAPASPKASANLGGGPSGDASGGASSGGGAYTGSQVETNTGNQDAGTGDSPVVALNLDSTKLQTNLDSAGQQTLDNQGKAAPNRFSALQHMDAFLKYFDDKGLETKRMEIECAMGWTPEKTASGKAYSCPSKYSGKSDDVFGACYDTGNYELCSKACASKGVDCGGALPDYFSSCLSAHTDSSHTPGHCITDCIDNQTSSCEHSMYSASNMAMWDNTCVGGSGAGVDVAHCLPRQKFGPESPCKQDPRLVCQEYGVHTEAKGAAPAVKIVVAATPALKNISAACDNIATFETSASCAVYRDALNAAMAATNTANSGQPVTNGRCIPMGPPAPGEVCCCSPGSGNVPLNVGSGGGTGGGQNWVETALSIAGGIVGGTLGAVAGGPLGGLLGAAGGSAAGQVIGTAITKGVTAAVNEVKDAAKSVVDFVTEKHCVSHWGVTVCI